MPADLRADAYSYQLPPERIAQRPVVPYDRARLLTVNRHSKRITEGRFCDLPAMLEPGDVLVFNDSRVIPARLLGRLPSGGRFELLLVEKEGDDCWRCLGKPLRKLRAGVRLPLAGGMRAEVLAPAGEGELRVRFRWEGEGRLDDLLQSAGTMPIPPYIRKGHGDERDRQDYNAFFARAEGSIAAPTASLHFTLPLMNALQNRGCGLEFITLHVGPASFLPLWSDAEQQVPRSPGRERYRYSRELVARLQAARAAGRRVIAVGTTVVRALESSACEGSERCEDELLEADLFIRPSYEFKLVDCLITNFHQPRTTHLLLVQALLGRELLDQAYKYALGHEFRFLSYGDGMLIL